MRDPKDALLSWFFSMRDSHPVLGEVSKIRVILTELSLEEGLLYSIKALEKQAYFECIASWSKADLKDHERILLFEDLVESEEKMVDYLLKFFSVDLSLKEQSRLVDRHKFSNKKEKVSNSNHYRRGIVGEWEKYFSTKVNSVMNGVLTSHGIDYISFLSSHSN